MIRTTLAAAATLTAVALVLAGCSSPSAAPSASASKGGDVALAGPYPTNSLDPHGANSAAGGTVQAAQEIFARLVQPTSTGAIVGDLATKWSANADATTRTFTLRKGVKFSDGTALTAQDVIGSFNRMNSLAGPASGNFHGVTVASPKAGEVQFSAATPLPALLGQLTVFFVTKGDVTDADFTSDPIGEGPFKVQSFTPSQSLVLVPNPDYYGKVPVIKQLTLRNIPDVTARLTALQTGEIQATWGIPDDQLNSLKSDSALKVTAQPSTTVVTMWFNSLRPALQSAKVRNALWQAIDFPTIIKSLYPNTGAVAKSPIASTVFGYAAQDPKKYDAKAAKAALTAAGFDFSQPLEIQYDDPQYTPFLQAVASYLSKVGVNAQLQMKDAATWLKDLLALNWDVNFQPLSTPTFDAATNIGRLYTCAARRTGYCNPDLDKRLTAAGSTNDRAERQKNYAAATKIIWDDAVGMYPMDLKIGYAVQSSLSGFVPDPSFLPQLSTVHY